MNTKAILARLNATLATSAPRPEQNTPTGKFRVSADADTAVVHIYDEIGGWGIWASDLVPALRALKVDTIEVHLNSPGGDYFDGVAIGNALAEHSANVVMHVDGMAASAASIIAMAGDDIIMHPGSQMMIHDALTMTYGNAAEHEKTRTLLDSASQDIAQLYAVRSGTGDADTWRTAMQAETWYRGDEAVSAGLATSAATRTPAPDPATPQWATALAAFRDVSRETSPTPVAQAPAATPPAVLPSTGSDLTELLCSALREAV